jgi:tripartite-type tricarboxylate transporter receptor subunit TctC
MFDLVEEPLDQVANSIKIRAGKLSLLAFVNRQRAPFAAEILTMAEAGFADLTFEAATGFLGWRNISTDLRGRIALDVQAIAVDSAARDRLLNVGAVARGSTPAGFAAIIGEQRAKIANIARTVGLRPTQ